MTKQADCFGWLLRMAQRHFDDDTDLLFVHARLLNPRTKKRYWHAYMIDTFSDQVFDHSTKGPGLDLDEFKLAFKPTNVREYNAEDIIKNVLRHRHAGPWDK